MDYYAIGQRIRKFRKARGLTQEQLAEAADISVTHMSHIETGNTKLSLPVFVAIAEILQIQTDELLYDNVPGKFGKLAALDDTIALCTPRQLAVIVDLIKGVKGSLDLVYEEPKSTNTKKTPSTYDSNGIGRRDSTFGNTFPKVIPSETKHAIH